MKFSYNWLQEFFKDNLPEPKKLAELLTMHSFEVEGVKEVREVRSASGGSDFQSDFQLDIDILPNRMPDASSHWGVAKEIAVLLKSEIRNPKFETISKSKIKNNLKIEIKDKELCPRYTALELRNVKVGDSPDWLKQKLELCGLNSINNIVDAGNYVMLELGQPLHVFDADKLGNTIVIRKAKKGEKITTLDDKKYDLDENVLLIADAENPVALAGIKGGKEPEVDLETKNIVLEAANFNEPAIRKGSQKLNLRTDASIRFSAGLDPNLTEPAIWRLAQVIQDLAGGEVAGIADAYPKKIMPIKIKLEFEKTRSLLGIDISDEEIGDILKRLDFREVEPPAGGSTSKIGQFEVPTIRTDIKIQEDLIEEVGRIYGYEKIKPQHPRGELVPAEQNDIILWREKIKNYLTLIGFTEIYNYSFTAQGEIEIANPPRPDKRFLRTALAPVLLEKAVFNLQKFKKVRLFEIGNVFSQSQDERENLALIVASKEPKDKDNVFLELKGAVSSLLESLGIKDEKIGTMDIQGTAAFAEFSLEDLIDIAREETEFRPISRFPSIMRDIAVLVPFRTRVAELLDVIEASGGDFLMDIDLFDMYAGKEIPQGKKNFAFRLVFQSYDKTLTDKEVNGYMDNIIKEIEKNPSWEVRKQN